MSFVERSQRFCQPFLSVPSRHRKQLIGRRKNGSRRVRILPLLGQLFGPCALGLSPVDCLSQQFTTATQSGSGIRKNSVLVNDLDDPLLQVFAAKSQIDAGRLTDRLEFIGCSTKLPDGRVRAIDLLRTGG